MKLRKFIMVNALSLTLLASSIVSANAISYNDIVQVKGNDRYATASAIAGRYGSYDTVVLVNGENGKLVDGLSASGLSGVLKAPILLVSKDKIPNETQLRMARAKKVYIIGSSGSVSNAIEQNLKDPNQGGFNVIRISGKNRFETSINVAKKVKELKGSINKVFIANGRKGEADAMSASAVAARDGVPIILTDGTKLNDVAMNLTKSAGKAYAIGGDSSISEELIDSINATRISGSNRYSTNSQVVKTFFNGSTTFYLSDGYKLVDALTGGPLAGKNSAPIVLIGNNSNKTVLSGAKSLISLGGISETALNSAVNAANR